MEAGSRTPRNEKMDNKPNQPQAEAAANSVYLTKQQAAQLLSCTPRFLERAVAQGRLKALKPTAKFWRVRQSDLNRFLESGATVSD
jgi:excisionase family DNA binding protein